MSFFLRRRSRSMKANNIKMIRHDATLPTEIPIRDFSLKWLGESAATCVCFTLMAAVDDAVPNIPATIELPTVEKEKGAELPVNIIGLELEGTSDG